MDARHTAAPRTTAPIQARPVRRTGSSASSGEAAGILAAAVKCHTLTGPARDMCYAIYGRK
jgi:hypothetical protein